MPTKIPTAEQVSGPTSLRPTGNFSAPDASGLAEGIAALGQGVNRLGQGVQVYADKQQARKDTAQITAAEAKWLTGSLDIGNRFSRDNDWRTFNDRAGQETTTLRDEAAALIDDPEARQKWLDNVESRRVTFVDSIGDQGRKLEEGEYRSTIATSLEETSKLITDPELSDQIRDKARKDMQGILDHATEIGMITPGEKVDWGDKFIRGADNALAVNRAELMISTGQADFVNGNLGISANMGGKDIAGALAQGNGGKPVPLNPDLAEAAARIIGDGALPSDPAMRAAYLSDPEMNARYVTAATEMLTQRFNGDMTAAVIAMAPGGSIELADQWVKSGHDESKLPAKVRDFYRATLDAMAPEADKPRLNAIAAPGVNIQGVDPAALDRWEGVQSAFGQQLPIISGARSPEHNAEVGGASHSRHVEGKDALDISTKGLSKEDTARLIRTASAMGFTGIGVYDGSLHIDMGERRAWGPSYKNESVPKWARDAIDEHLAGKIDQVAPVTRGVAKEFQALTFDQRLALYNKSKVAIAQQGFDMRAGLDVAVQNAPAAIMNTGSYDRAMPTAEDFVAAYGAADGIEKFKAFDASVDVANKAYGMRTMSSEDIAALVEASVPTSSGDTAGVEQKSFETLSTAAQSILKQREDDPAGYTMSVFPAVADAWQQAGESKDPAQFQQAIARMALAQETLGITNPELMPKQVAESVAATFNNAELPQGQRISALISTAFATNDPGQQEALYKQLVGAGVPRNTQGAMAALARGDQAAAYYLFKAAMFDPEKFPGKISETDANIRQRITEKVLDENQVGDVIYGLSDGTANNFQRLEDDGSLMLKAVKLRLVDGSASSLDQAIDMTQRDMFGDVKVVTGKSFGGGAGVKIVMPKDEDESVMLDGFNALLPTVGDAILADLTPSMLGALPADTRAAGMAQVLTTGRDMRVSTLLSEGYFTAQGDDEYVFIDPTTGQAIPNPGGPGPLIFSRDAVVEAAAGSRARAATENEQQMQQGVTAGNGLGAVNTSDPYWGF